MKRRVLIITYYWPPTAGSGVQRWLKFAKYLPDHDWQPVIYTPANPDIGLQDNSFDQDIDISRMEVLKTKIWDPSSLLNLGRKKKSRNDGHMRVENKSLIYRFSRYIRGNFFIPDSRILWKRKSVAFLSKYLDENPVDVVISTGPPHSMHLIAEELAAKKNIKWIMDLRDPMSKLLTNKKLGMGPAALRRYENIESRLLNQADIVLSTSPGMPLCLQPFDQNKFVSITNGFDPADFSNMQSVNSDPNKFILSYAGLLSAFRNPENLLMAIEALIESNSDLMATFEFRIAGIVSESFRTSLDKYPKTKEKTIFYNYLSHDEIIRFYQESTVLLLLMNNDSSDVPGSIPGKLFEYLAAQRPILSLGPLNSEMTNLFTEQVYSAHLPYESYSEILTHLKMILSAERPLAFESSGHQAFTRQNLTKKLVDVMNKLV